MTQNVMSRVYTSDCLSHLEEPLILTDDLLHHPGEAAPCGDVHGVVDSLVPYLQTEEIRDQSHCQTVSLLTFSREISLNENLALGDKILAKK